MDPIEKNEVPLDSGIIDIEIPKSAQDDEIAGSMDGSVEKGVFKVFNNKLYNQRLIDPYSCTLVSAFTALANSKNVDVPLEVIQSAFQEYKDSGEFTPGIGGKLSDGAKYAVKHFNSAFGTNISYEVLPFTIQNAINALKSGFAFTSGIKYGPNYFKNEQDDGQIQSGDGVTGNFGHAIAFVKINTMDDQLIKYTENYHGILKFDIILADFVKNRPLFFQSMVRFYE